MRYHTNNIQLHDRLKLLTIELKLCLTTISKFCKTYLVKKLKLNQT